MADRASLSLQKIDPDKAWLPWEPTKDNPWNLQWAAHLYRRAGFGAGLRELRAAVKRGVKAAVDFLLEGDKEAEAFIQGKEARGESLARGRDIYALRGWWLDVMLHSPSPLREKMTLFWHNHFATSVEKVNRLGPMFAQTQLLRQNVLAESCPLLLAM